MKSLLLTLLLSTTALAGPQTVLSRYRVNPSPEVMKKVGELFEVERRNPRSFDILVPSNKANQLKALVPGAELITRDTSVRLDSLLASGYRELPEVFATIKAMAQKYPNLVQLVPYGKSKSGKDLVAVKFSDNVRLTENESQIMVTAATHGDELITVEVLLNLMKEMLENYSSDLRIANILNTKEIYFIPVVNPDGFSKQERYDHWVDPNRSYPYPGNMNAIPTASIAGLIKFFESKNMKASLDLHAFGEMIMYPWAYTYESIKGDDEQKFYDLARRMAETNRYKFGPISKVIYVAKGSSADYYYMRKKTAAFAIEIGESKVPRATEIPKSVDEMREPVLRFLENF